MRYKNPPAKLFSSNRSAFSAQMKPQSVAVFHANDPYTSNGDASYHFQQSSNLYYLTGLDQEEIILVLFPDAPEERFREMLFLKPGDPHTKIWEGWKYSKEEAREASGIQTIFNYASFGNIMKRLLYHFEGIYLDINEHGANTPFTRSAGHRLAEQFQLEFPTHQLRRAAPILEDLRVCKQEEEIQQMQKAIDITADAFHRLLPWIQPGKWEYEIEAEILHEFIRQGADGVAFDTIVASGADACVLHYIHNDKACEDGALVLIDMGAKYGNYCADMTRTIPINGKFSPRQKDIYQGTLAVLKFASSRLFAGNTFEQYNREVGNFFNQQLLELNLLTQESLQEEDAENPQAYKKYCMHSFSHFLGLDTHDVGNRYQAFREGMILTCEPGIYVPEEGIGVRLENDILITADGPKNLQAHVLLEADEIEAAMAKKPG